MLKIEQLAVAYGAIDALHGISLEVGQGEVVALLGANGAGKTTLLGTISGLHRPKSGAIRFEGEPLANSSAESRVKRGLAHVPEGRRIFPGLTVRENLELGLSAVPHRTAALRRQRLEEVFRHFPRLEERIAQPARTMATTATMVAFMSYLRPRSACAPDPPAPSRRYGTLRPDAASSRR